MDPTPRRGAGNFLLACVMLVAASAHSAPPPSPTSAERDDAALRPYHAANGLLGRGMYDLAAAEYREFLGANPGHEHADVARYGLAVALLRSEDREGAEAELRTLGDRRGFEYEVEVAVMLAQCLAARGDHGGAAGRLRAIPAEHAGHELADDGAAMLVECLYRAGRLSEAVDAAEGFAARFPRSPLRDRADLFAGLVASGLGDDAGAAARYRALLERSPRGEFAGRARLMLARSLVRTGDVVPAEAVLRELLDGDAGALRPDAMLTLAELLHDAGRADEAEGLLGEIGAQHPESGAAPAAAVRLARVRFDQGDYEGALAAFKRLSGTEGIAQDEAAYWTAKCLLRLGREREAAVQLEDAARRFPESPLRAAMRYDLAVAQVRLDDQDAAARTLGAFLDDYAEHPLRAEAVRLAASVALHTGDHARALLLAGELRRSGDTDGGAAFLVAEAHLLAGREREAAEAYRGFLEHHPEHEHSDTASLRLGTLLYRAGDAEGAREQLESIAEAARTSELLRPALLLLGDLALRREDWGEAEALLAGYLATGAKDSSDDALLKLGMARQRRGDAAAALAAFDRLLLEHPGSPHAPQARLERAQALLDTGERGAAAESLEALAADPESRGLRPYALLRLAGLAEEGGDLAAAERRYADAAASADEDALRLEALYHSGRLAAAMSDHRAAAETLATVADATGHRRAHDAAVRRAISLSRAGDARAALEAFEGVERAGHAGADPALADAAAYEWAWCLREIGRTDEAAAAYRALLDRGPDGTLAAYAALDLAEMLLAGGEPADAAALLERVHEAASADPSGVPAELGVRAAYRLGVVALCEERFAEAAAYFQEVCDAGDAGGPLAVSAGLLGAEALSKLGNHGGAIRRLEGVLVLDPGAASRSAALLRLGDAYGAAQRWEESERSFASHALEFPTSDLWFQARFGLGWARENLGRFDEAVAEYRAVVEKHSGPTAARAQFQIGECLFAMGRHEEAARELLKVDILYAYPQWSAAALFEAGRCFEAMGDAAAANEHFAMVQARHPGTRWAALAAQRLEMTNVEPLPGR